MLVIVDFDCRHPLPGDISLVAAWLWRGRRKKKEKEGEDVGEPRHVMIRLETYAAFNDFTECHRLGKASATSPPFLLVASNKEKTTFFSSFEAMRRRGGDVAEATMSPRLLPICVERRKGVDEYNMNKKIEHVCKSLKLDPVSISAVEPKMYSKRFIRFLEKVFPE
ncbi:hypothetical protein GW17_00052491 [Ensete ventricosum]|nr:hypothetical protein GW17_00052491 [Ensete ventricosum]